MSTQVLILLGGETRMAIPKQRSGLFSWSANQDLAGGFSIEALYGLAASGTNQATAALCGSGFSQFTAVASGTGCILPKADIRGRWVVVENSGGNDLLVYPSLNTKINGGVQNAPYTLASGDVILCVSSTLLLPWALLAGVAGVVFLLHV